MHATNTSKEATHDLHSLVQEGQEVLKSGVHRIGEQAQAKLDMALETANRLKTRARDGAQATDRAIRQYPYPSLAIALGVGVVIGYLLQRR